MLTPKSDELVADPFRHEDANKFFEDGFTDVFRHVCDGTPAGFPITVFYAFKQSESDDDGGHASTGWETLLEGMIAPVGPSLGTWPVRTELSNRHAGSDQMRWHRQLSWLAGRDLSTRASPTDVA